MGRKNVFADLIDEKLTAVNQPQSDYFVREVERSNQPTLGSKGAVGAMSRSLEMISAEREAARALTEQLISGQSVVEVDPVLIDESLVPDRMKASDEDHILLMDSIRDRGQLVPVLLRPHPKKPGRFQTAYGHRRIRAIAELRLRVRAVVKDLTDEELVIAQGKENSERKDLSFIERATYAMALEDRGFDRDVIMAALNVDKTELSRLISVSRAIPNSIVEEVGPAPKTGRRRWMDLVELLSRSSKQIIVADVIAGESFLSASSDGRFLLLLRALSDRRSSDKKTEIWTADDGTKVARIERTADRINLAVDEKAAPAFGDFVVSRLAELYRAFCDEKDEGGASSPTG
jgi:ParB family transcriptional regulator, chromosome partitioning protein